jgi:hypothetical protein
MEFDDFPRKMDKADKPIKKIEIAQDMIFAALQGGCVPKADQFPDERLRG